MPLATLLDRLGGLLSKYFIVGQFFPALIFGFVNAAILYGYSSGFRTWSGTLTSGTPSLFNSVMVLIGISVVGYLLSCVNGYLREVLEGKHFPTNLDKLRQKMEATQRTRYNTIQQAYQEARNEASRISDAKSKWTGDLSASALIGIQPAVTVNGYAGTEPAGVAMNRLRALRQQAKTIGSAELSDVVVLLCTALRTNNIRVAPGNGLNRLSEDRRELLNLIDYAKDAWSAVELQKFNQSTRFGIGDIAPTALGNVAASMQGYGITRYNINLETFWPRLQLVLASANKDYYQGLLDSKTQLDFLVACCWLSAISTVCWFSFLLLGPWWLFLAVAGAGPMASVFCYKLAVENYVAFTELVRASVDLYRFQLLQQLHVALPGSIRDERATWKALQRLSTYGQESVDLSYQIDPKGGNS